MPLPLARDLRLYRDLVQWGRHPLFRNVSRRLLEGLVRRGRVLTIAIDAWAFAMQLLDEAHEQAAATAHVGVSRPPAWLPGLEPVLFAGARQIVKNAGDPDQLTPAWNDIKAAWAEFVGP